MISNLLARAIGLSCIFVYLLGSGAAACDASLVLCSPKDVRTVFEATDPVTQFAGTFKSPALVSDDIYIRSIEIPSKRDPAGWDRYHIMSTYALNRQGAGKWFTFVGGHDLVEKILVVGQYNATKVFRDIGYGSTFQCDTNSFYWLFVFRKTDKVIGSYGVYKSLQAWLDHVYGDNAPQVPAYEQRRLESERFAEITGCPVDPITGAFDAKNNLDKCDIKFSQAVREFWASSTCADPQALTYSANAGCPTDAVLASLGKQPEAVQMRAYLYAVEGFNEYNTGYGYTANAYNDPLSREYWTDNAWIKDLPEIELLQVQCSGITANP